MFSDDTPITSINRPRMALRNPQGPDRKGGEVMEHKQALEALLVKVEAGEWPDDYGAAPLLSHLSDCLALAAFEGSLDAAKALHDAVLPGWWFAIDGALASVSDMNDDDGPFFNATVKGNPARAWLCAILKALIAREAE